MEFFLGFLKTFSEGSVDRVIYGDYIVNRRFFLFTVVWPVVASPNRASGHLGGWWATPWSAEEMLDGQHQTVDIPALARTAHKGLLQKKKKKNWKRISAESSFISSVRGLNRTELQARHTERLYVYRRGLRVWLHLAL